MSASVGWSGTVSNDSSAATLCAMTGSNAGRAASGHYQHLERTTLTLTRT